MKRNAIRFTLAAAALSLLAGCGPDPVKSISEAQGGTIPADQPFVPQAEAGIRREPSDPTALIDKEKQRTIVVRNDPFALRPHESSFDKAQFAAMMNSQMGWYSTIAEERVEVQPTFESEDQPARRLAGILIGETITALIDMGDGKGLQTIHPGQILDVGDQKWMVQTIDEEKAILRRMNSQRRPQYVVVRLEDSASMGAGGGAPGGGTAPGGGQGRGGGAPRGGSGQQGQPD